ncbi:MAG: acetylxylan esterase [Verrucomicrobia bacterium]|nr:acetylxylan esterase [Verrucomicrobiota bacterium]
MNFSCQRIPFLLTVLSLSSMLDPILIEAQPKGYNYEEAKVPKFNLPDPLICLDGTKVKDAEIWQNKRRPEILRLFEDEVYGRAPGKPQAMRFEVVEKGEDALGGKAVRRQVVIHLGKGEKALAVNLLLFLPKKAKGSVPGFLTLNFRGNHTTNSDPAIRITKSWVPNDHGTKNHRASEAGRGGRASRWDIETIISRGYAFGTIYCGDIDPDFHDGYENGPHPLFPPKSAKKRKPTDWASIAGWAWGLSRGLDYLETDANVDAKRVAVMGHSRLGKTSLWAGAADERFALVISNDSGCGGAALSRRRFGETVKRINTSFPHWFCGNYKKYNDKEDECPVDQHMLIALAAPRPVYIASAEGDRWADPNGEFLSALNAEPVYQLFGHSFGASKQPPVNKPVHGRIGYHVRTGKHDVTSFDWEQYLNFADKHLK